MHEWKDDIQHWLAAGIPNAVAETFVLHQDERSPHLHVTLVPVDASGQYISWARVRPGLAGQEYDPKKYHVTLMKETLKHLYDNVSPKYGLEQDRGSAKVPREVDIDRNQGELSRAAEGGYSDAYLAGAREQVRWAATEGPALRAEIGRAELQSDDRFDFEVELLERYRQPGWQGRNLAIRNRSEGTIPLIRHHVDQELTDLQETRSEVEDGLAKLRVQDHSSQTYFQRREQLLAAREQRVAEHEEKLVAYEQMFDDYKEHFADLRDRLRARFREAGDLLDDLRAEYQGLREKGERVASVWSELADKLKDARIVSLLRLLADALHAMWDDSALDDLADRLAKLVDAPVPVEREHSHYRRDGGGRKEF